MKTWFLGLVASFFMLMAGVAEAGLGQPSPWQLNFQAPATQMMERIHQFHWFLLVIITLITLFVLALLVWVVLRYNAKSNPTPSKVTHNTAIEIVWTLVPVLILVAIAIPSFRLLFDQGKMPTPDLTVKATAHQWYWSYEYPDHGGLAFDSAMLKDNELKQGQPRLLAVDNEVVVPVGKVVRVQLTSADVLHAFAVPSFGIKTDTVPGRLTETWFKAEKTGVFYGQCSELCGRDHAFMPIAVRVVTEAEFQKWLADAKKKFGAVGGVQTLAANIAR